MKINELTPRPEALYYHIATDALEEAKNETDVFKRKQRVVTAIVFSALCLEAFINQAYCLNAETIKFFKKNEKLSLKDKWLELPRVLGEEKTFKEADYPFTVFSRLVKLRNTRLVHFKPLREKVMEEDKSDEYFGEIVGNYALAAAFLLSVGGMILTLDQLTHGRTGKPRFLDGWKYTSTKPIEVLAGVLQIVEPTS